MNAWLGRAGTSDALPSEKPSVWLLGDGSITEAAARGIGAGCEEEGVPLAWDVRPGDASDLARAACMSSRLEVGIGLDSSGEAAIALVSVTDRPYLRFPVRDAADLRWIGQAAARISKGQPVPEKHNNNPGPVPKKRDNTAHGGAIVRTAQPPKSAPEIDISKIVSAVMMEFYKQQNKLEGGMDGHEAR